MNEAKVKKALDACRNNASISFYDAGVITMPLMVWTTLVLAIEPVEDPPQK